MLLPTWDFYVKCLEGHPKRLFIICNSTFLFLKVLYFDTIINVSLISHKLNKTLNIINMCGPSNGKKYSRDSLTRIAISYRNQIIIEGSITNNVSLSKVWSTIAQLNCQQHTSCSVMKCSSWLTLSLSDQTPNGKTIE